MSKFVETAPFDSEILIVDDDPMSLNLLVDLVTSAGYRVRASTEPGMALDSALSQPPDLFILDVRMPGMDGIELCRRLKKVPRTQDIPVLFISASIDVDDQLHGFQAGGVDYITKPVKLQEVLARIGVHIDLRKKSLELSEAHARLEQRVLERTADLAKSENQFRRLIEKSPDIVYRYSDLNGGIYYSPRVEEILGYSPRYLLGHAKLWHDSIHPDDLAMVDSAIADLFLNKGFDIEYRIQDAYGEWHWFHDRNIDISQQGDEYIVEGLVSDITQRKQMEQELIKSENKSFALLEAIPDLIFRNNSQGVYLYFRAETSDPYIQPPETIIGKSIVEILPSDIAELLDKKISKTLVTGEIQTFEYKLPMRERGIIDYEARMVKSGENEVTTIVRDISERKIAENELHQSRERLRALSTHLQQDREDEKKSIAREIHDELGGTLTAIKLDADWLQGKLDNEEQKATIKIAEMADSVLTSIRRIVTDLRPTLLDDMGLRAALEWHLSEFEKRTGVKCAYNALCENCSRQDNCDDNVFSPDISITLFRIVQEALTNVSRHASASQVEIECQAQNNMISFKITDNGIGFDTALIKKPRSYGIRGMFERAGSIGGSLQVETSINTGTAIKVNLPINGQ